MLLAAEREAKVSAGRGNAACRLARCPNSRACDTDDPGRRSPRGAAGRRQTAYTRGRCCRARMTSTTTCRNDPPEFLAAAAKVCVVAAASRSPRSGGGFVVAGCSPRHCAKRETRATRSGRAHDAAQRRPVQNGVACAAMPAHHPRIGNPFGRNRARLRLGGRQPLPPSSAQRRLLCDAPHRAHGAYRPCNATRSVPDSRCDRRTICRRPTERIARVAGRCLSTSRRQKKFRGDTCPPRSRLGLEPHSLLKLAGSATVTTLGE